MNFDIFGGFQKNKYFLGYENFVDIFLGSSQNWNIFRGHFYGTELGIFFGLLKCQIFFWGAGNS